VAETTNTLSLLLTLTLTLTHTLAQFINRRSFGYLCPSLHFNHTHTHTHALSLSLFDPLTSTSQPCTVLELRKQKKMDQWLSNNKHLQLAFSEDLAQQGFNNNNNNSPSSSSSTSPSSSTSSLSSSLDAPQSTNLSQSDGAIPKSPSDQSAPAVLTSSSTSQGWGVRVSARGRSGSTATTVQSANGMGTSVHGMTLCSCSAVVQELMPTPSPSLPLIVSLAYPAMYFYNKKEVRCYSSSKSSSKSSISPSGSPTVGRASIVICRHHKWLNG
jgi:hypothetical protein